MKTEADRKLYISEIKKKASSKFLSRLETINYKRELIIERELKRIAQLKPQAIKLFKNNNNLNEIAIKLVISREAVIKMICGE